MKRISKRVKLLKPYRPAWSYRKDNKKIQNNIPHLVLAEYRAHSRAVVSVGLFFLITGLIAFIA